MNIKEFIKKYDGKCLGEKQYNSFQNALKKQMKQLADNLNANLVGFSKGFYETSGFLERNGKYVYFIQQTIWGNRNMPKLNDTKAIMIRTAKHDKDFCGGRNNFTSFENCEYYINKLLMS